MSPKSKAEDARASAALRARRPSGGPVRGEEAGRRDRARTRAWTEKDLEKTQLYMWQVLPEVRDRIDSERLRMGNIVAAALLTTAASLGRLLADVLKSWSVRP
jgi:hypothetical protein